MTSPAALIPKDGWLAHWCETQQAISQAPPEFVLASGLATLSGTLGPLVQFELGGREWRATLWQLLMAPAGARKSTPVSAARAAILSVRGDEAMLPSRGSPEGFFDALNDSPDGFWDVGEIGGFLGSARKDYMAGIRADLCDVWDGKPVPRRTKRQNQKPKPPAVTAVATGRETDFEHAAGLSDFRSGLLSRFLVIAASSAGEYRGLQHATSRESDSLRARRHQLYDHLRQVRKSLLRLDSESTVQPARVTFEPDAAAIWDEKDEAWSAEELADELSGWGHRRGIQALKLAVLCALAERAKPHVIELDILWACQIVAWSWGVVSKLSTEAIGLDVHGQKRDRLWQVLKGMTASGGGCVSIRDFQRRVWKLAKRNELDELIAMWESAEMVSIEKVRAARGPAATVLRIVRAPQEPVNRNGLTGLTGFEKPQVSEENLSPPVQPRALQSVKARDWE